MLTAKEVSKAKLVPDLSKIDIDRSKGVVTLNEARELLQYDPVDADKWGDDFKKVASPTETSPADTKKKK